MSAEIHPLPRRPQAPPQTPFDRFCLMLENDADVMRAAGAHEMAHRQALAARIIRTMQAVIAEFQSSR